MSDTHDLLQLGRRLRALRESRGLTLAALADRAGFGAAYLSEVERGRKNLPFLSLVVLARALETSPQQVVRGIASGERAAGKTLSRERLPQHVGRFARELAGVPAGQRAAALAACRAVLRALRIAAGASARRS